MIPHNVRVFHSHHRYYEQAIGLGGLGILGAPADGGTEWRWCDNQVVEFCNGEPLQTYDATTWQMGDLAAQFCDHQVINF